jgi:hypothetical protein
VRAWARSAKSHGVERVSPAAEREVGTGFLEIGAPVAVVVGVPCVAQGAGQGRERGVGVRLRDVRDVDAVVGEVQHAVAVDVRRAGDEDGVAVAVGRLLATGELKSN